MKNKKSVRVKAERGYGPRHMMNAQEGSDAVPSDLPSPPDWVEEARRRVAPGQGLANLTPGILGGLGEAGSELAGMSKEEVAKLAISMLAGGEGEAPLPETPGAVPSKVWGSWTPVKEADATGGSIRHDGAGNYYQFIGSHQVGEGVGQRHVIVKPVEAPPDLHEEQPIPLSVPEEKLLKGQDWMDAYLKKLDDAGMLKQGPQAVQDALDALKEPPLEGPKSSKPPDQGPDDISYEQWKESDQKKHPENYPELYPPEGDPGDFGGPSKLDAEREAIHEEEKTRRDRGLPPPSEGMKRGKAKVGVAKGFGPTHAENSKEGEDLTKVNTDTVPAMLTPREAVLNRNAAELAGRGTIEKLNAEGNQLARKGVDLAAGGDTDVGLSDILKTYQAGGDLTPEEIARVIAVLKGGGGASEPSVATQVPRYGQYHDELPDLSNPNRARGDGDVSNYNGKQLWDAIMTAFRGRQAPAEKLGPVPVPGAMAQKGTSDMKSKVKQSKPAASGSPYVQAFQKLMPGGGAPVGYQGGGNVNTKPMPLPSQGPMPGPVGTQNVNQWGKAYGWNPQPQPVGGGNFLPMAGGGIPGGKPGVAGFGPNTAPGSGGVSPPGFTGGGGGMPGMQGPGIPGQNVNQWGKPYGWNPPGKVMGLADGTSNVGPIGTPPQGEQAYGPPVQLTSPQIQQLAKQTGISPTQIMGLMKAFQGGKDIYNSVGTGGYDTASPATSQAIGDAFGFGGSGYQGGISDIGYPPFVAPGADYDGHRGGWLGPYDPSFMIQRYAGGISSVPFR